MSIQTFGQTDSSPRNSGEASSFDELLQKANNFENELSHIKASEEGVAWYPYKSMSNVAHIVKILPGDLIQRILGGNPGFSLLDIGSADGDIGFFLERLGIHVDFLDNPPTNFNDCMGIRTLQRHMNSNSELLIQDVDRTFTLTRSYNIAVALGILYHLRNPMAFLITLALHSERLLLSTRIAGKTPDGLDISHLSLAYLLGRRESNDDPTNYWIFTQPGLERLLLRSGWRMISAITVGDVVNSNPVDPQHDERMFVYCERVENWKDLTVHHDF